MKVLDYGGLDHSLAKLKAYLDSRRARDLADADDLCYVDPDEGVSVVIDDPGVTGTVLWGAESANQVALSVNGTSKLLLKAASIAGLESSISTLSGYFINGSARNALSLGGYNAAYFASASGLTALQEVVAGKQDTINDLATIRTNAGHGQTAYGWGNHASAGYATQNYVNTALADYVDCITLDGVTYLPQNGEITLPNYPTTLPASDVYAWAKKASLDVNDIPSITTGKISDLETWIWNKGFVTRAVNDLTNYYLKSQTYTQAEVNALIGAINQFHYEIYPNLGEITSPASNVLYLIGPIGEGDDRYEEYVYANNDFVKIGETSIDLSDYINSVVASGSGNYISGFSKSGSTLTLSFGTIASWALAANKPSYNFSEIGSTPTTLAGYGITDAKIENGTITLGSNTITPLTSHQSLSGYVNAISPSAETDVYLCPGCDYFYDPAVGDPFGGIVAGTPFEDLPSDWVCPICGVSKANFVEGGRQFVSGVSKSSGSSTISFTLNRLALRDLSGANNLKAIEYASGSGLLKKNADGTWGFDANSYLTGITSAMVTGALGYTPFNAANFTQSVIKSTLGISDWALAATKPGYAFSELSSKPNTLAGYGIIDAASTSDLLSYLPLSGGTMTGDILFDAGHPMFSFLNGEVEIGSIFFDSTNGLTFSPAVDVEYKYLHTGNTNNITSLGTITTGVWQGSPIAANKLAIDFDWVFVANAGTYDTDDYIHVN